MGVPASPDGSGAAQLCPGTGAPGTGPGGRVGDLFQRPALVHRTVTGLSRAYRGDDGSCLAVFWQCQILEWLS